MTNHRKKLIARGFTLLELMITVAIIAIIAAVAIPSYIDYTKKTYYSELVRATAPFKLGVVQCFNTTGTFTGCSSGISPNNGIPPTIISPPTPSSAIKSITVVDGKIIAIPNSAIGGLKEDQVYILQPIATNGMVTWSVSGKGLTDGLTK